MVCPVPTKEGRRQPTREGVKNCQMKYINRILGGLFAVIFLGLAGVIWWQWDNLRALKQAMEYSSEELEQQLQENQQLIQDAVNAAPEVVIRDVTEEEREALKDGTLTQEELIDRLVNDPQQPPQSGSEAQQPAAAPGGTAQPEKPAQTEKPIRPAQPEETPVPEEDYQKKLSALIAEVCVLREKYTIELDNMYASAKAEYKAKPKSERTTEKLSRWAGGYISRANKLEKACDASMDDVVERMETLIRANNGDLSLVDTVVYTYANEKSLKKAFYMAMLEEKGLI